MVFRQYRLTHIDEFAKHIEELDDEKLKINAYLKKLNALGWQVPVVATVQPA